MDAADLMNTIHLDTLTGNDVLAVTIGGASYRFSELPVDSLGRLQAVIRELVPHPVKALAGCLDGLTKEDRDRLLDRAYRDALRWPPVVGTAEGAAALLGSEPGQIAALWEGLKVHHPETTQADAVKVFRQLRRDSARAAAEAAREGRIYDGEGTARRIFARLFGLDDPDDDASPKA